MHLPKHAGLSEEELFQQPHVAEARLESFARAAASDLPAVHDAPQLLLLLSDGSLLAYQAFQPGAVGDVRFARMHLPLLAAYTGKAAQSKASASACMTRFEGLGDGAGLFHRCACFVHQHCPI
jgi:hypothetical protein